MSLDSTTNELEVVDAVVVGAGFAGLYALYKLRGQGLSVRGFEAGSDVGGTWYWNRYPGARCDAPSLDYSFSFSDELEQEWDWTERYATQPEILRYLQHVAERFDLRREIVFDTRVVSAHYNEGTMRWAVRASNEDVVEAKYLVMAGGSLSTPRRPEIQGVEDFGGAVFHTGLWPADGVDLKTKRVGVIGTGSSAIQLIPLAADDAAELIVFQRTPVYSIPARNRPLGKEELASAKTNYESRRATSRNSANGLPVQMSPVSALEVSDADRFLEYDRGWDDGTPILFPYYDLLINQDANDTAAEFLKSKVRTIVSNPKYADALTSQTYPVGTKRLALDTGFYETFNRENVVLVDLRSTPLVEINDGGVLTSDAQYDLDVLIFATGFDAMTGAINAIKIVGQGGVRLEDLWQEGPRAYLGLCVAGFPNLFLITGPGSPSVLSNVVVSIEQHVEWVSGLVEYMEKHGYSRVHALPDAQEEWVHHVNDVASATLFPKAASWYMGANIPGKPRVFMPYAGGVGAYRAKCDEIAADGYVGFAFD